VIALQPGDVKLSENAGSLSIRAGKGEKPRSIPLNVEAREALNDYLSTRPDVSGDALFPGREGAMGERTVQRLLRKYVQRAGLSAAAVNVHTLRHTFCKNLVDAGVPLERVALLLGNRDLNGLRVYLEPDEDKLSQDVEKIVNL
jgi:integrase/recombinase XerC